MVGWMVGGLVNVMVGWLSLVLLINSMVEYKAELPTAEKSRWLALSQLVNNNNNKNNNNNNNNNNTG